MCNTIFIMTEKVLAYISVFFFFLFLGFLKYALRILLLLLTDFYFVFFNSYWYMIQALVLRHMFLKRKNSRMYSLKLCIIKVAEHIFHTLFRAESKCTCFKTNKIKCCACTAVLKAANMCMIAMTEFSETEWNSTTTWSNPSADLVNCQIWAGQWFGHESNV